MAAVTSIDSFSASQIESDARNRAKFLHVEPQRIFGNGPDHDSLLQQQMYREAPLLYREKRQKYLIQTGVVKGDYVASTE